MLFATTLARPKTDECNVLTKAGVKDTWRIHRTFTDDTAAHHYAESLALARSGKWPVYCVRGKRYALPIILALLMVAPALAQEGHHDLADRAEWIAPVVRPQHSFVQTESLDQFEKRTVEWETRCRPTIVNGRYQYAAADCDLQVLN